MHSSETSVDSTSAVATTDIGVAEPRNWWLYLLDCRNGRTYIGVALDVVARFELHVLGRGAKFTRANPPLAILGAQLFASRSEAQKAEYILKQLPKPKKLAWAKRFAFLSTKAE